MSPGAHTVHSIPSFYKIDYRFRIQDQKHLQAKQLQPNQYEVSEEIRNDYINYKTIPTARAQSMCSPHAQATKTHAGEKPLQAHNFQIGLCRRSVHSIDQKMCFIEEIKCLYS